MVYILLCCMASVVGAHCHVVVINYQAQEVEHSFLV